MPNKSELSLFVKSSSAVKQRQQHIGRSLMAFHTSDVTITIANVCLSL